ncbi:hypothetical protein S7711_10288 [Stachybotrys chartarum IBT 7711]|nr:hypothetical protein S7711_10288 [Stachybotrys chartarum IBT 7711]
MAIYIYN